MKKTTAISLSFAAALILSGCGGGGGGGGTTPTTEEPIQTAQLLDSAIGGVDYICGTLTGITDASGTFQYRDDCSVTFKIGNVTLGTINGNSINSDGKLFPTEIAGVDRNETSNPTVLKILQFVQSLDSDGDTSNGITVADATKDTLQNISAITLTDTTVAINQIESIVTTTLGKPFVSESVAKAHFETTLSESGIIPEPTPTPTPTNHAPTFTSNSTVSVAENQTTALTLSATDSDGNPITYSISGTDASYFTITNGVVSFKNAPDYETKSSYTFTATASDGTNQDTATITINITNINDVTPSFTSNATVSVAENQTTALTLVATDSDSGSITYAISGTDASYFNITNGVVTFKNAPDYETKSSYTFTATASDGTLSATQNVTVNITDISGTPVFSSPNTLSIAESSSTTALTLLAVDEDGDTMTYSITGTDASLFSINSSTGVVSFVSPRLFKILCQPDIIKI